MLKKRSWPYVIGTGVMLLALLLPGLLPKKEAGPTGEAVSYTLTFDADHRRPDGLTETASGGYYDAMTDGGAVLSFAYDKAKAFADGFLTLSDGGTFRNPWKDTTATQNRISGIMKIKAVFTSGSLSVSYGWEEDNGIEDGGAVVPLNSGEDYTFSARPSYFKIAASGETAIESLVLTYSCSVTPKPLAASEGLTFVFNESTMTYKVTKYNNSAAEVTVPGLYRASSTEDYYPVTAINPNAFYSCYNLTSIHLPDSIVKIGYEAFEFCSALKSMTLPAGLESLGEWAFNGCKLLPELVLPAKVKEVFGNTFAGCTALKKLSVDPMNETYKFAGECIIKKDNGELVAGCNGSTIPVDQGIKRIGKYAFYDRSELTEITIPDGVTNIDGCAFKKCAKLQKVIFPQNTEYSIGSYQNNEVFMNCTNLAEVDFGAHLLSIGGLRGLRAFQNCGFTSLILPASVKTVGGLAFAGCGSLEWLVLPEGITQLGESDQYPLFNSGDVIKRIYYSGTQEEWNDIPKYLGDPSALIVAYYSEEAPASTSETKYWHYVSEGVPELWPEASAAA